MVNKKVEYGIDHKNDKSIYLTVTYTQDVENYDGKVKTTKVSVTKSRNRIIDLSIPEGEKGRITYTPWKNVK